jgi:hypothetical protein
MRRLDAARSRTLRWLREHRATLRNVAIGAVVCAAVFVLTEWWDFTAPSVGHSQYQAVFLTNGQTYFGRYYDRIGAYAKVEDVYYLQQSAVKGADASPQTRLVRRGAELHAPGSRMLVPKSSILFVEDLTDASPIAQFMAKDSR